MKTTKQTTAVLAVIAFLITTGCGSSPSPSSAQDELDVAIRDASDYLNNNIPEKSKIVILNIQSDFPALSDYIIDELISNTVNDRIFSVVDRQQLDIIRAEQNFQLSGEVDDKAAVDIGKLLGAQTIVSGAIGPLGERYRLRIRALEVQTAQVQGQYNRNMATSPTLNDLVKSGGGTGIKMAAVSGETPAPQTAQSGTRATPAQAGTSNQAQPAAPAEPALPAYKIGDTGPAGGLIFYDKGNNGGGWRYLEAGPVDIEFKGVWSVLNNSTFVENTEATIGSGKRNIQFAVEKFKQTSGEWDTAAQKVVEIEFNGFNDWFIPSSDELDQMYGNLKRRNLGDFKNELYMASNLRMPQSARDGYLRGQNFANGSLDNAFPQFKNNIRPIRQVPGPAR